MKGLSDSKISSDHRVISSSVSHMDGNKSARAKGVPTVSEKWGKFQVETDYADSGCVSPIYKGKLEVIRQQ